MGRTKRWRVIVAIASAMTNHHTDDAWHYRCRFRACLGQKRRRTNRFARGIRSHRPLTMDIENRKCRNASASIRIRAARLGYTVMSKRKLMKL